MRPRQLRPTPRTLTTPARASFARRTVAHEPLRTLAEVMAEHPRLGLHGIGIGLGYQPDQTPEQHALSLTAARASLTEREPAVREIAHWLRDHLPPVSTCYVDSYYLRRVAESATGVFYYDGQFIAAALAAGYPHRYGEERYLDIGVSGRDLKQITADPPRSDPHRRAHRVGFRTASADVIVDFGFAVARTPRQAGVSLAVD